MNIKHLAFAALAATTLALPLAAGAADDKGARPANEQVIVPEVDRRELTLPNIPSNDFELGLFAGTYATQNFGSNAVVGVRLGYHITEDVFVEGAYGQTKVNDDTFRQILPGGIFPERERSLKYYNLSAGWNVLPGEVFFGRRTAKPSAIYLIAGVGSTSFNQRDYQTFNLGFGARLFFTKWFAAQLDARDHIFTHDLLGKRERTHNLELTLGTTFFF